MKLHELRDFLAVSERGGVRAAARHLGLPQPAITRSIAALEKEFGVALFERHAKGVRLTPMGVALMRRSAAARRELERARDEIDQMRGATHGRLSVCLSSAAHMALLPQVLRPFRARYPMVRIEMADHLFPAIESALKDGTLDCYVGPTPANVAGELQVEKLFDNQRVILGRKGHPLANARSLRGLVDAEWITTAVTYRAEEELGPLFAAHGLPPPRLVLTGQSFLTVMTATAASDMLIMVPVQWLQFPPTRELLQQIKVAEPLATPPISIVRRTSLPLTPAAEFFCDLMRRAAAHREDASGKKRAGS
jgi:DNA-binding transcriptional LysR family regulator